MEFIRNTRIALQQPQPRLEAVVREESRRTPASFELERAQTLRYLECLEQNRGTLGFADPYGRALVLGSSVWPLFHAVQFGAALLLTRNRPTLKPSERVNAATRVIHDVLKEADSLWEMLEIRPGDRELGRNLVCSEEFDLVLFQGTYEAGMRILQDTLPQPGKEILLYLGAKNPLVLLGDPDEAMLEAALHDCFAEGGQNCLSASLVFVEAARLDEFSDRFCERVRTAPIFLMDSGIQDRYLKFIGVAEKEGAEIRLRGRPLPLPDGRDQVIPTVSVFRELTPRAFQRSVLLQTEIFGPHVSLIGYQNREELKALLSSASYGLACGIHSTDPAAARALAKEIPYSRVRINGRLGELNPWESGRPFRKSGNHGVLGEGLFGQITRPKVID